MFPVTINYSYFFLCFIIRNSFNTIATTFSTDNTHHFTLPCASSSNHSDKSTTFSSTTTQMTNGFISFANTTDGNPFTQQPSTKT
ncbi:unnamed protein product [Rotaria sp. Silwood2]|nr:unnamed protein product [Rotaria sp. Silwood2]CAF2726017.1 unnamed protein product [Rotaria sp. Silwood2]CAF3064111.1 unnamed protein product [Rotaria sp. Silwood2]